LLIHHPYTRVGHTDYQDSVFRQQTASLEEAMDLCAKTDRYPEPARLRWTCDGTGTLQYALGVRGEALRERLAALAEQGRIEVTALPFHLLPLGTLEALVRYVLPVRALREGGIPVKTACVCGVHGVPYGLVDVLADSDVKWLYVSPSEGRTGPAVNAPGAFWWESASGQRLLVWCGGGPAEGHALGSSPDEAAAPLKNRLAQLKELDYPFDFLPVQVTGHRRTANGGPDPGLCDFVKQWNDRAEKALPRMEIALPSAVFQRLDEGYGASLAVRRGDWGDWWADGATSAALETGVHRRAHATALVAERFAAAARIAGHRDDHVASELRETFWNLALYDEHTWGPPDSVVAQAAAGARAQWNAKAGFAYRAAHLARDNAALAADAICAQVPAPKETLVVLNPLPWRRDAFVQLPRRGLDTFLGVLDLTTDMPAPKWITEQGIAFVVHDLPPLGYKAYRWAERTTFPESVLRTEGNTLDNRFFRLTVDDATGAIRSWYDKRLDRELVDDRGPYGLAQYVYERIADGQGRLALYEPAASLGETGKTKTNASFYRVSPSAARVRSGRQSPLAASLVSDYVGEGFRRLTQEVTLYEHLPWVDIDITLDKFPVEEPEGVYFAFAFAVPGAVARYDSTGGSIRVGLDTLPGSCHDWHVAARWVDFSNEEFGVTVATPDVPLAQFGRINTGRWQTQFVPRTATLFSWVASNYWHTNFRGSQDGVIRLRYRLAAHAGGFDPVGSWRLGEEAANDAVVRELRPRESGALPGQTASLLQVEPAHVVLTAVKPSEDGDGLILRLREVAGRDAVFAVSLPSLRSARRTSPIEVDGAALPALDGRVVGYIGANELVTVRVHV
jgi:hypothetical protein